MGFPPHRKMIADMAAQEFAAHVLKPEGEGRWYCGKPGTGMYHFRVLTAPFAIIVYGDIGECILRCSDRDALGWLRSAVHDEPGTEGHPDYVLSKVEAGKSAPKEFLAELAMEELGRLREDGRADIAGAIEEDLKHHYGADLAIPDSPWAQTVFRESYHEHAQTAEVPECADWSSTMLRIHHALCTFVRLLPAQAQAVLPQASAEPSAPQEGPG